MKLAIPFVLLAACAGEKPAPETSDVGITVLPVASTEPKPLGPRLQISAPTSPAATTPSPEDRAIAERYFSEARALMQTNRVAEACELFQKSLSAEVAIGTMLNLADCNEKLGNVLAACNGYRDVEAQARVTGQDDRAELAKERAKNLGCR
jgi:hypothetical protein